MAELIISTLGTLQLLRGAAPLTGFLSDKTRALLVYLAVEQERPFRREHLAALLWPNQTDKKARANLRRALSNLRQVIDDKNGHYLLVTRQTLQFNAASSATIDVVQLAQLLEQGDPTLAQMEAAAGLAKGRFLSGFSISDSLAFEEWALLKREQTQRQLLYCLHSVATYYENHHQLEVALRYAREQVNLEPWDEVGQRQLLRLLALTKQRTAALAHYEQFTAELKAELSVVPEPATHRLYEQIRTGKLAVTTAVEASAPFVAEPPTTAPAPFVAREAELAHLNRFLQTTTAGQGQITFITGEAGSGKTCLMRCFAQQAQSHAPAPIPLWGECQPHLGPGAPYALFRSILAQAVGDIETQWHNGTLNREQINRLWQLRHTAVELLCSTAPDLLAAFVDPAVLPTGVQPPAAQSNPSAERLCQQLTHFLQKLSQHGPLLLLLDDLQWADPNSIDLLFYLRRQFLGYPIMILGTFRPEEILAPVAGTVDRHPLAKFVHEAGRDFGQIEVALNQANGRSFVDAWLDSEPNQLGEPFRQRLFAQTEGHPLFTVELVADMQAQGELVRDQHGRWQEGATISWAQLPSKAEAIIAERIGRLPQPLRHLLTIASVQGETFTAEVVAQLLDLLPHEMMRSLSADLVRRHRLLRAQGRQQIGQHAVSRYRFRHSLFQQYLYDRLDAIERQYWHQQTGQQLEQIYQAAEVEMLTVAAELAYHFEEADMAQKGIQYRQMAGQHALRLSAHSAASHHFRRCLALIATLPATEERIRQEIDCQLALGAALVAVQGYGSSEVKQVYERTYALCLQVTAVPEMVDALFWLTSYHAITGQLTQAVAVAQQMLALVEREEMGAMQKIRAHNIAGLPLFFMGRNAEALAHFQQASAFYVPERHQPQVYLFGQDPGIASMIWQGHVLLHLGRVAEAQICLQQASDWTEMLDHPYTEAFTELLARCTPQGIYLGHVEEGLRAAQKTMALAEEGEFKYLHTLGLFYAGHATAVLHLRQPNPQTEKAAAGVALMQQALSLEETFGSRLGLSSRYIVLADIQRQLGHTATAWEMIRKGEEIICESDERYMEAELYRVKGVLYWAAEQKREAEACWQNARDISVVQQARGWERKAILSLRRLETTGDHRGESQALLGADFERVSTGQVLPEPA